MLSKLINYIDYRSTKYHFYSAFFISLFFHIAAVIFSEGFHRPDEHLGIFRLMMSKLGTFPNLDLSWEFKAQIRPWFHPWIFIGIAKIKEFLFGNNPFLLATILRFFCSSVGLYSIYLWGKLIVNSSASSRHKKISLYLFFLCWYLPFFHARTTAENLGITFFIFAIYILFKGFQDLTISLSGFRPSKINASSCFVSGILLGLSFVLRFQMGIMIASLIIWLFLIKKMPITKVLILFIGIFTSIALNSIIDYWGYGVWTFTPWNYFYQNLILGVADGFGTSPWYYYLTKTLIKGIPPISLIWIVPLLYLWVSSPKHLITFLSLPFFLVHSYLGHKEIRFLFPMFIFFPFAYIYFTTFISQSFIKKIKLLIIPTIIINCIALTISSFKPAFGPISLYKFLYHQNDPTISKIYTFGTFRDQLVFYLKSPIEQVVIPDNKSRDMVNIFNSHTENIQWFLTNKLDDIKKIQTFPKLCKLEFSLYPKWILNLDISKKIFKRSKTWALFRCQRGLIN